MLMQSETSLNQVRKSFKIILIVFLYVRLKLIPSFQINPPPRALQSFQIFWKDCNARGGGLIFYVNEDLTCKVINKYPIRQDVEILTLELKLFKTNMLVIGTYKSFSLSDITFTSGISNILEFCWSTHDNIFLMADFNF